MGYQIPPHRRVYHRLCEREHGRAHEGKDAGCNNPLWNVRDRVDVKHPPVRGGANLVGSNCFKEHILKEWPDLPYRSATALRTSQLIPPILIHLTLTHGSRSPAPLSLIISTKERLVILPKLLLTLE